MDPMGMLVIGEPHFGSLELQGIIPKLLAGFSRLRFVNVCPLNLKPLKDLEKTHIFPVALKKYGYIPMFFKLLRKG